MAGRRKDGRPSRTLDAEVERSIERRERRPEPISLSPATVRASGRVHEGDGTRVRVVMPHRVQYTLDVELEGVVEAWTPRAVRVRAQAPDGSTVSAWVWASSVIRISHEESPQQGSNLRPTD